MSSVGISAIAYYLPKNHIDNTKQSKFFEVDNRLLEDKIGMKRLARKAEGETTLSMAACAVMHLCDQNKIDLAQIDCLILVTQNPDGHGLPHTSALLHEMLGLATSCAAFDVSLGCSGYVYGLSIIKSFMESNQLRKGLLITADPYSNIIDETDKNTSLLFGDAATATLLEVNSAWNIGSFDFGTDSSASQSLYVNANQKLNMNGRNVFNFSAIKVPLSIESTLDKNNLTMSDIDQVILHQGSRFIVETIADRIDARDKTPFVAANYGNTISSSIPLALAKERVLKKNKRIIIAGFGVGLSWATTVLIKKGFEL